MVFSDAPPLNFRRFIETHRLPRHLPQSLCVITYSTAFADYILGCGPAPGLLAEDCFQLGVLAYQAGRYGQGQEWLRMADQLTRQGKHGGEVNHTEVLEHLAWVEFVVSATSFFSLCSLIHLLSFIIAGNETIWQAL